MSDMRRLLEAVTKFAGEPVQKPGDQVRGNEPMPRRGGGKKHPFQGRLVGGESADNFLKELNIVIQENPVKRDLFQEWHEFNEGFEDAAKVAANKKMQEQKGTTRVRAVRDPNDPDNYHNIRFQQLTPDGSIIDVEPYSGSHNNYYRQVTGKEPGQSPTSRAMTDTMIDMMKTPSAPGKVISEPESVYPQDRIQQPAKPIDDGEEDIVAEWGAAGTAVGPGNDDADPVEIAAQRSQQVAGKTDQHNQLMGLVAQVNGARSELANLNKQFPQGANPVEKAMSMQQASAQKVQLGRQIEDLMSQVAAMRSQA